MAGGPQQRLDPGRSGSLSGEASDRSDLRRVFDEDWYRKRHPEVAARGIDPLNHYLEHGAAAGYDPHPAFRTNWYLHRYPDVAGAGLNPLVHCVRDGAFEKGATRIRCSTPAGTSPAIPRLRRPASIRLSIISRPAPRQGFSPGPLFKGPEDWEIDPAEATERRADYATEGSRPPACGRGTEARLDPKTDRRSGRGGGRHRDVLLPPRIFVSRLDRLQGCVARARPARSATHVVGPMRRSAREIRPGVCMVSATIEPHPAARPDDHNERRCQRPSVSNEARWGRLRHHVGHAEADLKRNRPRSIPGVPQACQWSQSICRRK